MQLSIDKQLFIYPLFRVAICFVLIPFEERHHKFITKIKRNARFYGTSKSDRLLIVGRADIQYEVLMGIYTVKNICIGNHMFSSAIWNK